MDDKKEEGSLIGAGTLASPGTIGQFRQLSIPLTARVAAVVLALVVLAGGGWLVFDGWRHCAAGCDEKSLESGTKILAAAVLPALAVVYLAFAETGVKALTRKIRELLNRTLPEAMKESATGFAIAGEIEECLVDCRFAEGSQRAWYRLVAKRSGDAVAMNILVELNVAKANVVFFIPAPTVDSDTGDVRACFREAMTGAQHEGYVFDDAISVAAVGERRYFRLIARKRLPENFLWDPALKLHFAQDLRMFAHAMIVDGWKLLEKA